MLSKQEIGLHSAPLKRGVLKAQETNLTWANKNKVIIEFLTMGKHTESNCGDDFQIVNLST